MPRHHSRSRKHLTKRHNRKGGRRSQKHRKSAKKGGMWGSLLSQAAVPAFLFGAQKSMQNRKRD